MPFQRAPLWERFTAIWDVCMVFVDDVRVCEMVESYCPLCFVSFVFAQSENVIIFLSNLEEKRKRKRATQEERKAYAIRKEHDNKQKKERDVKKKHSHSVPMLIVLLSLNARIGHHEKCFPCASLPLSRAHARFCFISTSEHVQMNWSGVSLVIKMEMVSVTSYRHTRTSKLIQSHKNHFGTCSSSILVCAYR